MTTSDPEMGVLTELLRNNKLEMPFSDFDDKVMHRIQGEIHDKATISRDIKLSFFFFVLGTLFGLFINSYLLRVQGTFWSMPKETIVLFFQALFLFIFFLQIEHFVKVFRKA